MVFCLPDAVAAGSRKRSASMERMPVERFSSSAVSSASFPCAGGRRLRLSPEVTSDSMRMARMTVRSPSRTSAAEEKRSDGCFSRHFRMTLLELNRQLGHDLPHGRRIGELNGANALELGRVGPVKGVAAGGHLVKESTPGAKMSERTLDCPVTNCSGAMYATVPPRAV